MRTLSILVERFGELVKFGFMPPSSQGMQNRWRRRFVWNSIMQYGTCSSGRALEIGVYKAGSTVLVAEACLKKGIREIWGIDLFTGKLSSGTQGDTYRDAMERLRKYHLTEYVTLIRSNSLDANWDKPLDVLFIDADHTYPYVSGEIRKYTPYLTVGGIVIFDDYNDYRTEGVWKAVNEFIQGNQNFEVVSAHFEKGEGMITIKRNI